MDSIAEILCGPAARAGLILEVGNYLDAFDTILPALALRVKPLVKHLANGIAFWVQCLQEAGFTREEAIQIVTSQGRGISNGIAAAVKGKT